MKKKKKKLLPKNFDELLEKGNPDELKAVFDLCDINARGGYSKQTALAYDKCPDDLARWLVNKGANLQATDTWGNTPLHQRARSRRSSINVLLELGADIFSKSSSIGTPLHAAADSYNVNNARLLIEAGAKINETNNERLTPLEWALRRCTNIDIENMVDLAIIFLNAGAKKTPYMKGFVEEIGKRFEFHRNGYNPNMVESVSNALNKLYELFEVIPVPRRQMHDDKSPIIIRAKTWEKQHQELWNLLVPSSGPATTIQGELIRISGRIANEIEDNGGVNWDADYIKMADAFLEHIQSGEQISSSDLKAAASIVAEVKRMSGDTARMAQLAVKWVIQNPLPIKLPPPPYKR